MSALQDSVMFLLLLGAQIIIVSSLAITALWLYFKRLKNKVITETGLEEEPSPSIAGQTLDEINDVHLAMIRDLEAKVAALDKEKLDMMNSASYQQLEAEKQKTEQLKKLNDEVVQKIQGLETRLLEYEVIKDEIGLFSQVKAENEKLKETIAEMEKRMSKQKIETNEEPGIEGLLTEIEALTAESQEPQRKKA